MCLYSYVHFKINDMKFYNAAKITKPYTIQYASKKSIILCCECVFNLNLGEEVTDINIPEWIWGFVSAIE